MRRKRLPLQKGAGSPNDIGAGHVGFAFITIDAQYPPSWPYVSIYRNYVEAMEPGSCVGGEYANVGEVLEATLEVTFIGNVNNLFNEKYWT
jgi:hypothetical protein